MQCSRRPWPVLLALAGLGGCRPPAAAELHSLALMPFADQRQTALPRWCDLADGSYSAAFRAAFDYAHANVTVTWEAQPATPYLRGTLHATGLKPNFCYQLKLMGRPGDATHGLWAEGEAALNEWLGRHGRWWNYATEQTVDNFSNDTEYAALTPGQRAWVAGYVYFGSVLTDATGQVTELPFTVDHSWHITGRTGQENDLNRAPGTDRPVLLRRHPPAYAAGNRDAALTLWTEAERDDPSLLPPLPPGRHQPVLMLTEESFHEWGVWGGNWRSVLVSDWSERASPHTGQPWVTRRGTPLVVTVADRVPDPPRITLLCPRRGDEVYGETLVSVNAEVFDGGPVTAEYQVDGGAWQPLEFNSETGCHEAMPTLASATAHRVVVRVRDQAGRETTAPELMTSPPAPVPAARSGVK